jgi:cytochrome c
MTRSGLVTAALVLAACGGSGSSDPDGGATSAGANAERGELLSLACRACHRLEAGGGHLVGPNLNGVFGRRAGSVPDYVAYSEVLRSADFVWTPELVDQWLADPDGFLPGTSMAFTGYQSAADRAALIEFLIAATQAPSPAGR